MASPHFDALLAQAQQGHSFGPGDRDRRRGLSFEEEDALREAMKAAIHRMRPQERIASFWRGEMTIPQCFEWYCHYSEEVPLINNELPWIALQLADGDPD